MARPRRRLVFGVLIVIGVLVCATTLWLGSKWKRALDNVEAMRVAPIALPTPAPESQIPDDNSIDEQPPASADDLSAPTEPPAEPTPIPGPDAPINILLLGTDARPGEDISRTDAMILVHLDP